MHKAWIWGLLFASLAIVARADERPNFVIMMTDDQRWDNLSLAGHPFLKTPNMDRIGREGAQFKNMFVTNSLCAPSRVTLLSGLYSHATGVPDNYNRPIRADVKLLPEYLREAGYEVAFCGKSHVKNALRDRPWDYYFGFQGQGSYLAPRIAEGVDGKDEPYEGYMDDVVTEHAIEFLKKDRTKPFCLFLFFKAPHRSWDRAPRHKDLFADVTVAKPDTFDDDLKGFPGKPRAFANADNKIGAFKDVPSLDKFLKDYCATLTAVDENIGKVFATLEATKQLDNTAMFFTGDNGFFQGEWKAFDKRFMHEVSIRVPMLVRFPKLVKAGSQPAGMVLNIDIMPTVLDLAGVAVPENIHGKSFVPLLKGEQPESWRKSWLYEYFEFPGPHSVKKHRGVRTDQYKYIHYYEEPQEYELYDLSADPGERNNLYGKPGTEEITKQLAAETERLMKETGYVEPEVPPKQPMPMPKPKAKPAAEAK